MSKIDQEKFIKKELEELDGIFHDIQHLELTSTDRSIDSDLDDKKVFFKEKLNNLISIPS